ncbi:MAG: hypothetical protein PVG39_00590 [Desulfobacteraceae bacterium]
MLPTIQFITIKNCRWLETAAWAGIAFNVFPAFYTIFSELLFLGTDTYNPAAHPLFAIQASVIHCSISLRIVNPGFSGQLTIYLFIDQNYTLNDNKAKVKIKKSESG